MGRKLSFNIKGEYVKRKFIVVRVSCFIGIVYHVYLCEKNLKLYFWLMVAIFCDFLVLNVFTHGYQYFIM